MEVEDVATEVYERTKVVKVDSYENPKKFYNQKLKIEKELNESALCWVHGLSFKALVLARSGSLINNATHSG